MRELSTARSFYITDQSANGTHIKPDHEDAYALGREYSQLEGGGYIGLGRIQRLGDPAIVTTSIRRRLVLRLQIPGR